MLLSNNMSGTDFIVLWNTGCKGQFLFPVKWLKCNSCHMDIFSSHRVKQMLGFTLRTTQHTTPLTTAPGILIQVSRDVSWYGFRSIKRSLQLELFLNLIWPFSPFRVRQSPGHRQNGWKHSYPISRQPTVAVELQWLCRESGNLPQHCCEPLWEWAQG